MDNVIVNNTENLNCLKLNYSETYLARYYSNE